MADSNTGNAPKPFGSPDTNPREWGNTQGGNVAKQPGTPKPTDIIDHHLQHSDYNALASGGVKGK